MAEGLGTALVTIRPVRMPADGGRVVALYREIARWHTQRWPADLRAPDERQFRSIPFELTRNGGDDLIRVAEVEQALVGLVSAHLAAAPGDGLCYFRGPVVWIDDLVVTESARRQGIGTMLMSSVEEWARGRAAASIALTVHAGNHGAQALYAAQGFRRTDMRMRKDL